MEDDLKILKVEFLSNDWLDFPQIWNLSSGDQTKSKMLDLKKTSIEDVLNNNWLDPPKI